MSEAHELNSSPSDLKEPKAINLTQCSKLNVKKEELVLIKSFKCNINIPSVVFVKLDSSWLVKVDFVFN